MALIIPFRDRQTHLTRLIDYLIPILKRQLLDFRFIVTEQVRFLFFFLITRFFSEIFKFSSEYDCFTIHFCSTVMVYSIKDAL